MQAMRRHAHKLLAALLCMCLLVSYTPLPASAAEDPYTPSVSDELDSATMTGENEAQVSTTVNVLTIPALAITGQTKNYAATIDQIAADPKKYDLEVSVTGRPPFTYSWSRTINGAEDSDFSYTEGPSYPLSQRTDTLVDGKTYAYKVVVGDQSGKTVETQIEVTVSNAYVDDSLEKDGVKVSASKHWQAVFSIESLPSSNPTYGALQEAAGGAAMAGAWLIDATGAPDGKQAFVGDARVELPLTGVEDGAEIVVVGMGSAGKPTAYEATVENGKAVFDTPELGAFALAWKKVIPPHVIEASVEGGHGQIDPEGRVEVADGDSKTFAFAPDSGYVLGEVKVDGQPVGKDEVAGNRYTFQNVTENHTISVSFAEVVPEPEFHKVSASVSGGHGTVSVEGSVFGASAEKSIEHGKPAAVAFSPESGYAIDSITMQVGEADPVEMQATSENTLAISAVEDDTHVVVAFKPGGQPPVKKHTVAATAEGEGTVEPASQEVADGASCQFTVSPVPGHRVAALTFGGKDVMDKLSGGTVVLDAVFEDGELHVVFEPVPAELFTVSASVAGEGGAIAPAESQQVAAGTSLTFYVHPDEGYRLASLMLSENGGAPVNVADRVAGGVFVLEVSADCTLTASFEESGIVVPDDVYYAVHASAGEGGSISPAGSVRVKAGGSQTFHFLPATGYKLKSVEVDGKQVAVSGLSYTLQAVAANASIEATFEPVGEGPEPDVPETHGITATAGSGGTVSPAGTVQVPHGGSMSFAFIPYAGFELEAINVDGEPLGSEAVAKGTHRFDNVVEGHEVHATFKAKAVDPAEPDYYTLTVAADEHGTAAPLGATRVAAGTTQTLYAYPDKDYVVDKVLVTRGATQEDLAGQLEDGISLKLEMTADTEVSVSFRPADQGEDTPKVDKFTLTSSATAGGTISPAGAVEVAAGGSLAYTVTPEAGYVLDEATVDGKPVAVKGNGFTVSDVAKDMAVHAAFKAEASVPVEPAYRTVSATAGEGGSISPAGSVRVAEGKAQTFYFYPDDGFALEGVYVDGEKAETATANSYTFASVQEDASIEARFAKLESGDTPPETPETFMVTASASSGGTVSPSGVTTVVEGGDLLLTFTPDEGCELKGVLLDGKPADLVSGNTLRLTGIVASHTVRAEFERTAAPGPDEGQRYTVKAGVSGGGGTISPAGETLVAAGSSQTFYFAPDEGKRVASVAVNDTEFAWSVLSYTLANISGDAEVTVRFEDVPAGEPDPVAPVYRTVTASVEGDGGTVSPAGAVKVADGGSLTLTFTPDEGWELASVQAGGRDVTPDVSANGTLRLDGIDGDLAVAARFAQKAEEGPSGGDYCTVSASAGAGGSISPAGDVRVARGANQTFTLVPDAGKHLSSLKLDGTDVTSQVANGTFTLEDVQADCSLRAEFASGEPGGADPQPPAATHTVTALGTSGGTVSPSGATTVAQGSSLTLTFTPDAGFELKKVEVTRGPETSDVTQAAASGVYVLQNVAEDATVKATFAAKQPVDPQPAYHTVTASVEGGHGSVSPAGDTRVKAGAGQTFLLVPDAGYVLDRVELDGKRVATDGYTYTLADVRKDAEVKAYFKQKADSDPDPVLPAVHTVTAHATAGGSVSPAGSFQAVAGTSPVLTITADAGYQLGSVVLDGTDNVTESVVDGALRLAPLAADVDVAVAFERTAAPEPAPADPVVTATAGKGGSISPAGQTRVKHGASQTFSLIPDAGFAVESITVDGSTFPFSGTSYTLFDVEYDREVSVSFKEEQGTKPPTIYQVSASATAGGEIVPEGDVSVVEGAALSVSFAAYDGYELYRVAVDEGTAEARDLTDDERAKGFYRFSNVKGDHTIRAFFALEGTEPDPDDPDKPTGYAVIGATAGAHGSIEPNGQVKVMLGAAQTFTFHPDEGYKVGTVTVDGEPVAVEGLAYTFEDVRAGASLHVTFEEAGGEPVPAVHYLTASATAGGSVEPSGRVPVDDGASKTFAVKADAGFELAYLLIDGKTVPATAVADGAYTFADVCADHAIRAVFQAKGAEPVEPAYAVVHAAAAGGGTISPAGDLRVEKGGSCAFVMLPDDGYRLQDVTVNGASALGRVQDGCRLVLEGVNAETTVLATFAELGGDPAPELPEVHAVHATSTSGGSIAPRSYVQVVDGGSVSFAVAPDEGYRLAKLVVDGADVPADEASGGTFVLGDVREDRSVRAVFERVPDGPAPEEPPYANVDVEVKVKVTAESVTNGGGSVQPDFISVPRGAKNLPFYVYPEEGHALESVLVNDEPVPFEPVGAASPRTMASRAAVFAASAPGAAGAYRFAVDEAQEDLVIEVTFRKLNDAEQPPAPVQLHRVEAGAAPGGSITPDGASSVPDGAQAVFGVKPDPGYRLASLLVTEGGVQREAKGEVAGGLLTLPEVRGDVSVRASFEPDGSGPVVPEYVVVHAAADGHGTVSPSGDVRVQRGGSQTFSFVPADGYTLDKVYVDGAERAVEGFTLMLGALEADTELRATFRPIGGGDPEAPVFHDVTVTANAGGRVDPSGVVQVADGKSLAVTLSPDEGYEAAAVKVNGKELAHEKWAYGFFQLENVTEPLLVEVAFAKAAPPAPGKVRITPRAGQGGSIFPGEPFEVDEGADVSFSFVPDAGYAVDKVLVNDGAVENPGTSYTLYGVAEDTTVLVLFKEDGGVPPVEVHTISASAGLHGSIVPTGMQQVVHGKDQLFVFQPDDGYVVDVLEVDGKRVENPGGRYLFKGVEGDHAIHVTFRAEGDDPTPPPDDKPAFFAIEASVAGGHGRISPAGTVRVERGKARTFDFLPDAGYAVSALVIDGERMAFTGSSYRFVDVQANHTLEAVFAPAAAPAPTDPVDGATRVVQQAAGYVKTGDANGALACTALVLAGLAACAALMARRRMAEASATDARTEPARGARR